MMDNQSDALTLWDYYMLNEKTQVSYQGPFDRHILYAIGSMLKGNDVDDNKPFNKKTFSIFIELAQNVASYSAENIKINESSLGIGTLIITEHENYYKLITGNLIYNGSLDKIVDKCETINQLDRDELRRFKREQRRGPRSSHGGANIGLIQVALLSSNPLDIEVIAIDDDKSFFALTVKIDK